MCWEPHTVVVQAMPSVEEWAARMEATLRDTVGPLDAVIASLKKQ